MIGLRRGVTVAEGAAAGLAAGSAARGSAAGLADFDAASAAGFAGSAFGLGASAAGLGAAFGFGSGFGSAFTGREDLCYRVPPQGEEQHNQHRVGNQCFDDALWEQK